MPSDLSERMRVCHFCGLPIPHDTEAVRGDVRAANAESAEHDRHGWAHFACWYDGGPPFEDELPAGRAALEAGER